ncbi:MAG: hypothetical protein ACWGMZ_06690, partial [Thermoguttaceae bacterium]
MNKNRMYLLSAATIFFLIAAVNIAAGVEPASGKKDTLESLTDACQEAKALFRPLTTADYNQRKTELEQALGRLEARLKKDGENGAQWHKFLLLDQLQSELRKAGKGNRKRLTEVYVRFASGYEGLGLVWFVDVQSALRHLLMVGGGVDNPQIKTLYEQNIDKLAEHLRAYDRQPNVEDALSISESVSWLKNAVQAPELVESIERRFSQPNLCVKLSQKFVNAGIGEPVDDSTTVRDCIMRTDIYGSAHTVGQASAELFPDDAHAVVDTLLFASSESQAVGYHGPVCIFSRGTTDFGACKRLWVDEHGVFSHPAVSKAVTQTTITDIQSRSGRRLIERIAWKKACKQKALAEYIAARHAEQRVNDRMDAQAAETLDRVNRNYQQKFCQPLEEHKLFPEQLRFSGDKQDLKVVSLYRGNSCIAAPEAPPPAADGDLVLQVHESMVNNFALDALGGMTVREEKFQAAIINTFGHLPEKLKGDEDEEPWAITFAQRQPISISFTDDGFQLTLRGARYYKGEAAYPAMDVTVAYKIEKTEHGFKAVRQGDIEVFPPGRKQVGGKEQIIRQLLTKRFNKIFEPELLGEGFVLPDKWKKIGKM